MELQEKEVQKDYSIQEILFRKNLHLKYDLILDLKPLRSTKPSCMRKETVDIDILAISRNGNIKIMQSIRITSTGRPTSRKRKWNQLSQL